jgi:hypothetical protein
MASSSIITEADILAEIVAPDQSGMSPDFAHAISELHFTDRAKKRIQKLLDKNNKGTINQNERVELDRYLRVGQFLDLIQAKARLSLATSRSAT